MHLGHEMAKIVGHRRDPFRLRLNDNWCNHGFCPRLDTKASGTATSIEMAAVIKASHSELAKARLTV